MKGFKFLLLPLIFFFILGISSQAQTKGVRKNGAGQFVTAVKKYEPREIKLDSIQIARRDSIMRADSIARVDSLALQGKSSLQKPAFSAARDSIIECFTDGHRIIKYYGEVTAKYEDIVLSSEYMEYDMNDGTIFAKGVYDSLSGEWIGRPEMTQGKKTFYMDEVRYNFNTRRSLIKNMVTAEEEALLHGKTIKMLEDKSINMTKGSYTVCDLEHPHYYLQLSAAKIITEPSRKTVFGPSHLVVEDVHIPFLGLPFGFIPERPKRSTGLLLPTFGQEQSRGFFMKDLGMYFVFGDNFDVSLTGSIFSLGSWSADLNSRYKFNYKSSGNVSFNYSYDQVGEKGTKEFFSSSNFGFRWTHQQDPKAHPGSNFSASVNFSSPSNNRYNSRSVDEALQNQISSSVSYSKTWNGRISFSINGLHSQNSKDSSYVFTLPNITFSVNTFYPFKRKVRVGKEKIYEKISFGYNTNFSNKISFNSKEFGQPDFMNKMQNGMNHNFNIGLPSFSLFKYINVNPSVSYGQSWFFRKKEYQYNAETDKVESIDSGIFGHFGITQHYSFSLSANTRLYGIFNFGKHHKIQAIRHVISPSISGSYTPELGTYANGYRTLEYVDKHGVQQSYDYNIYQGMMGNVPGKGQNGSIQFAIDNNLEAKVSDFADSTGKGSKNVKLIDNLKIEGNYNFLAPSFKMSVISMSLNTTLLDKIGVNAHASFDPYGFDETGKRIDEFAVRLGQGLLNFNDASFSLSYSLTGKGKVKGDDGSGSKNNSPGNYYKRVFYHPVTGEYIPGGWLYYTAPNAPWSLSFNYQMVIKGQMEKTSSITTHTLGLNGSLKLTPKLSFTVSSGFDFVAGKISTTQINASYDLHCFNISVSIVPTGTYKSYSFRIAANAAALSDLLKFRKTNSFWDNR